MPAARGLHADSTASFRQLAFRGGTLSACGHALELTGANVGWRSVELSDLTFADNLEADLDAGHRQSIGLRGCHLDPSGKRSGAAVDLDAGGETIEAPNLIAENTRAETTQVASVQLSGGTNLNLLQPGDLIVLSADADDIDDLWTTLKATRGGLVHKVVNQTPGTARHRARHRVRPATDSGRRCDSRGRPLRYRDRRQRRLERGRQ